MSTERESLNPGGHPHQSTVVIEKDTLLWVTGVPNSNAAIITQAATNSSEEPGTSMGGVAPQGLQTLLTPRPCWITLWFYNPYSARSPQFTQTETDLLFHQKYNNLFLYFQLESPSTKLVMLDKWAY